MELQTNGKPLESLLEKVLCMNILSSDYFKELYRLKTYHEVIDEIYNQVDHVEPWMTGNCRGPSTSFCLLYKFFTMKLTVKQMHGLLQHKDSPYIRAVGFLYLRYAGDPKTLWNWFEPYIKDDEEFSPGSSGRKTTMGVYVRDLLLGQYYFDTLFPRIPVPVLRQITSNLEKMKLPTKISGATGDGNRHGSDDTARRPPSVKAALSVSFGQRAPHRASTRDSSPVRRTLPPPPMTEPVMIHESVAARVVNILIKKFQTGIGIAIGVEKGIETVIWIERGTGIGREIGTGTGTERGNGDGDGKGIEIETEGMILTGVPGTLIGKAEGIMNVAAVMELGITGKVDLIEAVAGAGAGAGAEACKLAHPHLIATQLLKGMEPRIRHLRLAIWQSSEIFMAILGIRKGMLTWKGLLGGIMMVKRFLDLVVLLGGR
ncbi:unnamed protein product [Dovyalis caffra]|uniref:Pre-mRNA-splicing factor 38 n=1 Tax=Dovyalis caffra TaxID=77055 RepID=A0AAV1RTD6_9ROSI|nr:unnamed protein product [Dovyalis caffra]